MVKEEKKNLRYNSWNKAGIITVVIFLLIQIGTLIYTLAVLNTHLINITARLERFEKKFSDNDKQRTEDLYRIYERINDMSTKR
jgi:hypothetical protein